MVSEKEKHSYDSPLPDQKSCCQTVIRKAVYTDVQPRVNKSRRQLIRFLTWFPKKEQFGDVSESGYLDKQVCLTWGRCVLSEKSLCLFPREAGSATVI